MKTVVVLGTHRSGTSLVTGMLHTLGVNMGPPGPDEAWIYPNWANPTGQYENPEITDLLHKFLDFDGEEPRWDPAWEDLTERARAYRPAFLGLFARTRSELWGWKHPWSLLVLDDLVGELPNPYFVVVRRDLHEVVDSLHRRDGLTRAEAEKVSRELWARMEAILRHHPEVPTLAFRYEEILADPRAAAQALVRFLGLSVPEASLARATALVIRGATLKRAIRRWAVHDLTTLPVRYAWLLAKDLREGSRFTVRHLTRSLPREAYRILRAAV